MAIETYRGLDVAIETALATIVVADDNSDATALVLLDREAEHTHLGITVEYPDTANENRYGGATERWGETTTIVRLAYQLRVSGQKESKRRARDIEEQIIVKLVQYSDIQENHPRWIATARDPQSEPGWYLIDIEFGMHLDLQI